MKKYYSTTLTRIVAKGANIAYDLICCVGMLRFIHHKQITDVWQTMILKYVSVPLGSISYISDKFLTYLIYVHEHSSEKIKEIIPRNGCYVMHIDGTQEKGSEVLLEIKDEVSGITLISKIIPTENSEDIIPVLKLVKERFGIPLAIVRDNGPGIVKACNEVFPGVPQQSCHFHFLRDLGNALFKTIHSDIKKIFSKKSIRPKLNKMKRQLSNEIKNIDNAEDIVKKLLKDPESVEFDIDSFHPLITYSIVRRILNYEKEGNGYGFPFDQSYRCLYERCQKAKDIMEDYIEVNVNNETYYESAMDETREFL